MKPGLWAVSVWQGNTMVLRVGWFRPEAGDDWQTWWVTPYRGEYKTRLSQAWVDGPPSNWEWGPVVESVCSRLQMVPLAKLDPAKWIKVCPCPEEYLQPRESAP